MLYNSDSVDGRLCLLLIIQMQIFSNFSAVILKKQNIKIWFMFSLRHEYIDRLWCLNKMKTQNDQNKA